VTRVTHNDETVTIGGDLTVGRIGYGAMQLTGPKLWGEYPDHDKGVGLLREVMAAGVTYIDTADVYGPHSNEELIREALHPYRDNVVIATKGGFVRSGPAYADMGAVGNRHYLRQAAHMSARRLGLDHIDLHYLHTPTMTDAPFEEIIETLARGLVGRYRADGGRTDGPFLGAEDSRQSHLASGACRRIAGGADRGPVPRRVRVERCAVSRSVCRAAVRAAPADRAC
jgi:hypothetical protein